MLGHLIGESIDADESTVVADLGEGLDRQIWMIAPDGSLSIPRRRILAVKPLDSDLPVAQRTTRGFWNRFQVTDYGITDEVSEQLYSQRGVLEEELGPVLPDETVAREWTRVYNDKWGRQMGSDVDYSATGERPIIHENEKGVLSFELPALNEAARTGFEWRLHTRLGGTYEYGNGKIEEGLDEFDDQGRANILIEEPDHPPTNVGKADRQPTRRRAHHRPRAYRDGHVQAA